MAIPRNTFGASAGFGIESTWGTPVSRTNWLRVIDCNVQKTSVVKRRAHQGSSGSGSRVQLVDAFIAAEEVDVDLQVEVAYDDSTALLMSHVMGASSFSTGGSGPYTHTGVLKSATPNGLTMEEILSEKGRVVEGLLWNRAAWSISPAGILLARYKGMAQTCGAPGAAGTPTYSSNGNPVMASHAGSFAWNSNNLPFLSGEWVLDNGLVRRQLVGSLVTAQPAPGSFQTVTGTFQFECDTTADAVYTAHHAGTVADGVLAFTNSPTSLTWTFHNLQWTKVSKPIPAGAQIARYTAEFICQADMSPSGDQGMGVVLVNGNSAITAN